MTTEILRNGVTTSQGYQSPAKKSITCTVKYSARRVNAAFVYPVNPVTLQFDKFQ